MVGDLIVKERPVVRLRDLSISGRPAWLLWRKHRWSCRSCQRTFTQSHPVAGERARVSLRLRRHLGNRARSGAAHAEVARDEHVSRYHVAQGARFSRLPTASWPVQIEHWPRWISLDEAAHRRNRELPTVISAPEQRRVLDVIPGRSKQAVQRWLQALPADVAAHIKVVSIDPYDAYRRAIQAELPHAVIVCDPFHLVRGAGTAMDSVRRDRQRVARTSGRLAHGARQSGKQHNWQPELYRSRRRLKKVTRTRKVVDIGLVLLGTAIFWVPAVLMAVSAHDIRTHAVVATNKALVVEVQGFARSMDLAIEYTTHAGERISTHLYPRLLCCDPFPDDPHQGKDAHPA